MNRKIKFDIKTFFPFDDHHPHPEFALVGQPNCGKSTIFNSVSGYRSISTNFPGATVEYTKSHIVINGRKCNLVDLPGIYSLTAMDKATEESKKYLLNEKIDVIINVVDASLLSRSLELTLQLLELNVPMILCLNMMDDAARKGVTINFELLHILLNIPVIPTVAAKGQGLEKLFHSTFETIDQKRVNEKERLSKHVVEKIKVLEKEIINKNLNPTKVNNRLIAIKLLEDDPYFGNMLNLNNKFQKLVQDVKSELEHEHEQSSDYIISAERHNIAMHLFEKVAQVQHPKRNIVDQIDNLLMHPFWGYIFMLTILYLFFNIIFKFGSFIEPLLLNILENLSQSLTMTLAPHTFFYEIVYAILQGFIAGLAIVFPYILPFLLMLALIEDVGYLPRIAFLMDSFMHRIGLHGTAVIPGMLGYGCSVPAIMATRILASPRDRFIGSVVAILIPCSARMVVIMGLVGYYLGGNAALGIYFLNIITVTILGAILSKLMPEDIPGMILEMPSYHMPKLSVVLSKTWLRIKDFIIIAWPLLIIGSIILGVAEWYKMDAIINGLVRPITYLLDLPPQVGTTLIFGLLRKELALLMLFQALGTQDVASVMTHTQILVFTLFVVFYIPCLATLGVMGKEVGWKKTVFAALVTFFVALLVGLLGRFIGFFIFN